MYTIEQAMQSVTADGAATMHTVDDQGTVGTNKEQDIIHKVGD